MKSKYIIWTRQERDLVSQECEPVDLLSTLNSIVDFGYVIISVTLIP